MKRLWFHFALGVWFVNGMYAASPVGPLPNEKEAIVVSESERNPFGKRGPKTPVKAEDNESEEAKIRGIFESLPVSGVGKRDGKFSVLLGSFVVQQGIELPDVLPQQTEHLRVLEVDDQNIELGFVEKDGSAESRTIKLRVRVVPEVRYDLGLRPAVVPETQGTGGGLGGVIKMDAGKSEEK